MKFTDEQKELVKKQAKMLPEVIDPYRMQEQYLLIVKCIREYVENNKKLSTKIKETIGNLEES